MPSAIKIFKSSDLGAPPLTGQLGNLILFFDAVLQNGYGSVNVVSIVRTSTTATVTTATPHGLSTGDSATIGGAAQAQYNVDAVVTVLTPTVFTYSVVESPATPATGTITAKRSPVGYTKAFAGTHRASYRCNDLGSNRHYLRVLDDGGGTGAALEARMWCYESMTDVDAGVNMFPTVAQSPFGYICRKSNTSDSVPKTWMLISNGKLFYFLTQPANTTLTMNSSDWTFSMAFGDVISFKPGDVWATALTGGTTQAQATSQSNGLFAAVGSITSNTAFASSMMLARDFNAVPGPRYVSLMGSTLTGTTCIGSTVAITYPHPVDNGFYVVPIMLAQGAPSVIRGRMPGLYDSLHGRALNNLDILDNVQGLSGRKLMCLYGNQNSTGGCVMVDITGPWDS